MNAYKVAFSTLELSAKLERGDPLWGAFTRSFENLDLTPAAMACLIDDGHAFTTWHANGWRDAENYICGQHLGLDFDSRSVEQALADPFIDRYAAIVYATPSSTPEAPHSRAVFLLDQPIMQAANYVRAALALIWSFGAEADRRCRDACRFFYGSVASMPVRRDRELPLSVLREMIGQHEAIVKQPVHRRTNYTPNTKDAKDAVELLRRLSPRRADDYDDWIGVGMALSTLGDEGLQLWDNWSAGSSKHVTGECARKWKSFDRKAGNMVTMATVALWAQQDTPR